MRGRRRGPSNRFNIAILPNFKSGPTPNLTLPKPVTEEKDTRPEAFEKEYKDSHPNGPYPPVEIKPRADAKPT